MGQDGVMIGHLSFPAATAYAAFGIDPGGHKLGAVHQ
jgi:hypothetical protein